MLDLFIQYEGGFRTVFEPRDGDAGYDIASDVDAWVPPGSQLAIGTGARMQIPDGYCGILKSRSGLAAKENIHVAAGVIDSSYRGEILVLLRNEGHSAFTVRIGDRIAQMVIVPVFTGPLRVMVRLPGTERGEDGFGSTGR